MSLENQRNDLSENSENNPFEEVDFRMLAESLPVGVAVVAGEKTAN